MRSALWRASRVKLLAFACVALVALTAAGVAALFAAYDAPTGSSQVMQNRPVASGSPDAIAAAHDCWTGAAPADMRGRIPGHVVVTLPTNRTTYAGPRYVHLALEQVFDGKEHGLTVHAFCR